MRRVAIAAIAASCLACTHDFSIFEPTSTGDGGAGPTSPVEGGADAAPPLGDAATTQAQDAALPDGATSCGSDCRIEALSCAGICAEDEQSCAAPCAGDAGCTQTCLSTDTRCTAQCVTTCETCTSGEGCLDQAGCAAAAP
jgi:hypothetical protein